MRFGAFLSPYHRPDGHPGEAVARDLALVERLERLGLDEAWFGEHHSGGWEISASPEIMIAAAAQRTRTIRLGTGVISLPYHHPLVVADRIVQLDHLTRGRAMFGLGSGALEADARMMGIAPEERGRRFADAFEAVTALLRGDGPVTRATSGFVLQDARLHVPPLTRPSPSIYVASSFSGAGLRLAARHGAGLVLLGVGPDSVERFREAERALARDDFKLDRGKVLVVLNLQVGDTRRQAVEAIRDLAAAEQYEYWSGVIGMPRPDHPPSEHVERMIERGMLIIGSPGECIDSVRSLLHGLGPVGGVLVTAREWASAQEMSHHWSLFAREVAPAFRTGMDELRAIARGASRGLAPAG